MMPRKIENNKAKDFIGEAHTFRENVRGVLNRIHYNEQTRSNLYPCTCFWLELIDHFTASPDNWGTNKTNNFYEENKFTAFGLNLRVFSNEGPKNRSLKDFYAYEKKKLIPVAK